MARLGYQNQECHLAIIKWWADIFFAMHKKGPGKTGPVRSNLNARANGYNFPLTITPTHWGMPGE